MIDALLYAVRDAIRNVGYGYDDRTCEIMADGAPKPSAGAVFLSVHGGHSRSTNDNCLMEYFGLSVTLTMRVNIPLDRVGDELLAKKLAKSTGFNRRTHRLCQFLHMNWGILQDANNYMVQNEDGDVAIYGFCEPLRYRNVDTPKFQGPGWFSAAPTDNATDVGLVAEMKFDDARRFSPIADYV